MEKTKQRTEIARINGKIREEQRKIDDCHRRIGEMFVEAFREEAPEEFMVYINQIDECRDNIEHCKVDIDHVKGMKKCPRCGEKIGEKAKFCPECGLDFEHISDESGVVLRFDTDTEVMTCPECGSVIKGDAEECPACGVRFEK